MTVTPEKTRPCPKMSQKRLDAISSVIPVPEVNQLYSSSVLLCLLLARFLRLASAVRTFVRKLSGAGCCVCVCSCSMHHGYHVHAKTLEKTRPCPKMSQNVPKAYSCSIDCRSGPQCHAALLHALVFFAGELCKAGNETAIGKFVRKLARCSVLRAEGAALFVHAAHSVLFCRLLASFPRLTMAAGSSCSVLLYRLLASFPGLAWLAMAAGRSCSVLSCRLLASFPRLAMAAGSSCSGRCCRCRFCYGSFLFVPADSSVLKRISCSKYLIKVFILIVST